MYINLSEQCINELCMQLSKIIFRRDFAETLQNHYLEPNNIDVPNDIYEGFIDDVYEYFNEYHDYEMSWDSTLESAMDNLTGHGDYVLQECCECGKKTILRGDDDLAYTVGENSYCEECYNKMFTRCRKCGCDVSKQNNPILVHDHYYCNDCARMLLTHLMEPDVTTNE